MVSLILHIINQRNVFDCSGRELNNCTCSSIQEAIQNQGGKVVAQRSKDRRYKAVCSHSRKTVMCVFLQQYPMYLHFCIFCRDTATDLTRILFLFLGVDDNIYSTPEEEENHEYLTLIPDDNLQIQGKQSFVFFSVGLNDIFGLKSILDIETMILAKILLNS